MPSIVNASRTDNCSLSLLPCITKYTATTVGRDKLYRFIQYLSKFIAYRCTTIDPVANKDLVDKLNKLIKHLSLSRKLMRIGRPLEYIQNLITGVSTTQDPVIRWCLIGKNTLLSMWMAFDFLLWAQGVGIWKSIDSKRLTERNHQFWFSGLLCGIISTVYQIHNNMTKLASVHKAKRQGNYTDDVVKEEKVLLGNRAKLLRQIFQESLDILVPAKGLGYHSLSDGVIGLTGALTSVMGAQAQWNKLHGITK